MQNKDLSKFLIATVYFIRNHGDNTWRFRHEQPREITHNNR
jgi:hypothetical protein